MFRIALMLFITICNVLNINSGKVKYEVVLEKVTNCSRPQPPYASKRTFISTFTLRRHKERILLSGNHRVLEEVPFYNFSVANFRMTTRQPELMMEAGKLNCRSMFGKMFLHIGGFQYSSKDCRLERGSFGYNDMDFDKLLHTVPNWHSSGRYMYRSSLVFNDTTVFCLEMWVLVHELK